MKVYDKPDRSVSLVWECESCPVANGFHPFIAFADGEVSTFPPNAIGVKSKHSRWEGRWRPYIANNPEPWPPKKLMPRRCWATVKETGERCLFIYLPHEKDGVTFRQAECTEYCAMWKKESHLSNIVYIDPEQEAVEVTQ